MRTALVTGASGFLGRYIARELSAARWRVIGLDRAALPQVEMDQLGLAELHVASLPTPELDRLLATLRPEAVVHAAGPASVPRSVEDPVADFQESVPTLLGVLESVRRANLASRVVFLSSAAVYGNPTRLPVTESAEPDPISPYGFHKLLAENLLAGYTRVFGVPGCTVRIFSAYGPQLRRQVLWDVSQKVLREPVVELLGTGDETRDFIHAADVARGVGVVLEKAEFRGEVYNLATGIETSIRDLAHMLANALGRKPEIVFSGTSRKGDPRRWRADISRLRGLGFAPQVAITDGVAEYAAWVQEVSEEVEQTA